MQTLPPYPDSEVHVPEGHAWVEGESTSVLHVVDGVHHYCTSFIGDEPYHSEDSNRFGPVCLPGLFRLVCSAELSLQVPLALLDSKLSYILWPLERMGPILKPTPPGPKAKRGPAWRKQADDVDRARRREARVTVHSSST